MKNNKVLVYALIISLIIHSALILFLLGYNNKKTKKYHKYTKPVIVEPYKFIKNLEKFKIKNPKYASIKPHSASKNTRLKAPSSYRNPSYAASMASNTPPAEAQNRRIMSSSHIFSNNHEVQPKQNQRLSSLYPMGKQFFNQNQPVQKSGIKNPSHGVKSATVNLNTTTIKYASYLLHVKNKIENVWEYPARAQKRGISGLLVIEFSINRNGSIYRVKILRSSGKKMLDRAAVKAIYDAARYNPFPHYWTIKRLNIIGTFIYRLANFYLY
ncbi:MAG: energy transducer TonB [Deltaproteobacteria bacterium]|jgi:protein TonB|nr:energy transducer TonB [Deltaproteobacteria bacterium]MCL5880257.1 energy transducer TonB [Deltaproteobacteria bacterium]MDA8303571.1 energy transducer TonB [Deltaproteobacteria bacterium]